MAPVYFFREHEEPYGFLSQWYEARFMVLSQTPGAPSMVFLTTEQYMMYQKAILFGDTEVAEKIMAAKTPKKQKALGRQVKGFDEEVWKDNRERIVEEANWHKFSHPARKSDLKKRLLETEKRELVEASPYDRIWGVGYNAKNAESNRDTWGDNLLGKALMRVRDRVHEQEDV